MATLQTVDVAAAKIKVRWEEPYSGQVINSALSALPRGIYRGGQVVPGGTGNKSLLIKFEQITDLYVDTFWAYRDETNGLSLGVRETASVEVDMSSAVSWPISGAQTWYLWGKVTYALSTATTGAYYVTDTSPPDDAIVFARVDMLDTDTEILAARITAGYETTPAPSKIETTLADGDTAWGLLHAFEAWRIPSYEQKRGLNAASPAPSQSNAIATLGTKLDDFSSPDDNTDLNVSTSVHGLCPKLSNNAVNFLNGQANFEPVIPTECPIQAGARGRLGMAHIIRIIGRDGFRDFQKVLGFPCRPHAFQQCPNGHFIRVLLACEPPYHSQATENQQA